MPLNLARREHSTKVIVYMGRTDYKCLPLAFCLQDSHRLNMWRVEVQKPMPWSMNRAGPQRLSCIGNYRERGKKSTPRLRQAPATEQPPNVQSAGLRQGEMADRKLFFLPGRDLIQHQIRDMNLANGNSQERPNS